MIRHFATVVFIAGIALVSVACGDDDEPADTTAPADSPPTDGPSTDAPSTDVTTSNPASTDPVSTDPPATDPASTDPPSTDAASTDPPATDPVTADPPTTDATTPDATTPEDTGVDGLAAWQQTEVTDVEGNAFTLGDYVGRPLLVETFATWCSKCLAQLGDTQEAAAALGEEAAVVALSVETDLSSEAVAHYAAEHGFANIRFAVMSPELLAQFVDTFGNTVANPPTTPKVVVDSGGTAGELTTGAESAEDLVAKVQSATA